MWRGVRHVWSPVHLPANCPSGLPCLCMRLLPYPVRPAFSDLWTTIPTRIRLFRRCRLRHKTPGWYWCSFAAALRPDPYLPLYLLPLRWRRIWSASRQAALPLLPYCIPWARQVTRSLPRQICTSAQRRLLVVIRLFSVRGKIADPLYSLRQIGTVGKILTW